MIEKIKTILNETTDNIILNLKDDLRILIREEEEITLIPKNVFIDVNEETFNNLIIKNLNNISFTQFSIYFAYTYEVKRRKNSFNFDSLTLIDKSYKTVDIEKLFDEIFKDLEELKYTENFKKISKKVKSIVEVQMLVSFDLNFKHLNSYLKRLFMSMGITKASVYKIYDLF